MEHLRRAIALARDAFEAGDEPFGSVLVSGEGEVLAEDRNRTSGGDGTRHPEFELARWAARNLSPDARARATVYTSGEHCPMCAAAHALVGLGRIVFAASAEQYRDWLAELGGVPSPGTAIPARDVAPGVRIEGPVEELADEVRELHRQYFAGS